MKQWMKYTAVVCCFLIMIGVCFPNSGNKANASEVSTVSGNGTGWILTVKYDLDGGNWNQTSTTTVTSVDSGGNNFIFTIPQETPANTDATLKFSGWSCDVDGCSCTKEGKLHGIGSNYTISSSEYNGKEITFIAQWTSSSTGPDEGESGEGETLVVGKNMLKANTRYVLGAGTWTVSEDTAVIVYTGGKDFYVSDDGTYTFNQQSQ